MRNLRMAVAVLLAAVMVFALMPLAAAAPTRVKEIQIYNYNQNDRAEAYDPTTSTISKTYAVIQAPYDKIARSNAMGQRVTGPHYEVVIVLENKLAANESAYIENTNGFSGPVSGDSIAGRYDADIQAVITTFTPVKGGNSNTITLKITDANEKDVYSHNITIYYIDDEAAKVQFNPRTGKYTQGLRVSVEGNDTYYKAYMNDGKLLIDYQPEMIAQGSRINLTFSFKDPWGYQLPGGNNEGYIYSVVSNGDSAFIKPSDYNRASATSNGKVYKNSIVLPVTVDPTISRFSIGMETADAYYMSNSIQIFWRPTQVNSAVYPLTITPSRAPSIRIGEEYTFQIRDGALAKESGYYLAVSGTAGIVSTVPGSLTIKALSAGTTSLNVLDSKGKAVDRVNVTVLSNNDTPATAPATSYTLKEATLVYSGPASTFSKIGFLKQNEVVSVRNTYAGFAVIEWKNTGIAYIPASALSQSVKAAPAVTGSPDFVPETPSIESPGPVLDSAPNIIIPGGGMGFKLKEDTAVKRGPGSYYGNVGTAVKGSPVMAISVDNYGWAYISWNDVYGYVPVTALIK